ncbi:MAG: DUF4294 domain-containing protein [Prolixibacteraceae bacterium]
MTHPIPNNLHSGKRILILLVLILSCISIDLSAQTSRIILQSEREKAQKEAELKNEESQDTMLHFSFPPIEIRAEYIYKNKQQERKYYQLYEDVKRTYPLSQIVSSEVKLVNAELDSIYQTKNQRKAYLKWYQKHTFNTYIDTLKSLNIRQIKLFVKLIKRETGSSPFDLIKKYRGGMDAFLWQLSANALLVNLKSDYDPIEDAMIEDIIRKFF